MKIVILRSFHEKEKPNRFTLCENSYQLRKHIAFIHDGNKAFKCKICGYSCSEKGHLEKYAALVHEGARLFKCEGYDEKIDIYMILHFMKEEDHSNVKVVTKNS